MSKRQSPKQNRESSPERPASVAFERFDNQMTHRLSRLVARWQHLAAPSALRVGRSSLPVNSYEKDTPET